MKLCVKLAQSQYYSGEKTMSALMDNSNAKPACLPSKQVVKEAKLYQL